MRGLLAFAVIACLGVVSWLWLRAPSSPPPAPPSNAPTSEASQTDDAVGGALPDAPDATDIAGSTATAAEASRVAPVVPLAGPDANLQVIAADTREPIQGAVVHYTPPDFDWQALPAAEAKELQLLSGRDQRAFLERIGRVLQTDADGRCVVPTGQYGTQASASSGERFGVAHVQPNAKEPVVLALRPDRALRVLVLDATGKPCPGASIRSEIDPADERTSAWQLGQTDTDGRLVMLHCQLHCHDDYPDVRRVAAQVPGCSSQTVEVDFGDPPPEVALQLPPTGVVTVHLRDAEGKPIDPRYLGDENVRLATLDARPTGRGEADNAFRHDAPAAEIQPNGDAVFTHVGLDKYLLVTRSRVGDLQGCDGPTRSQPQVEITLAEGADDVIVTATIRDADGSAWADRALTVTYVYERGMGSQQVRTDAEGRMRCNLSSYPRGKPCTLRVGTSILDKVEPLETALPERVLEAGIHELGEIQLEPLRVLLTGRLLADAGIEVQRTQLQIEVKRQGRWQQRWNLRPVVQEDGSFTFKSGIEDGTPLRLVVGQGAYLPVDSIECVAGASDLEVRLRAAGSASATFLVDEHTPYERLAIFMRDLDPDKKPDPNAEMMERMRSRFMGQPQDGRIRRSWNGLVPGVYELTVTCAGVIEPLARLGPIRVEAGPCDDPRLVDIDLRNRLRSFEIRAVGPDGTPVAEANAFVVVQSDDKDWNGYQLTRGVVELATPSTIDVIVLAKGFQMERVAAVAESRAITLRPAVESVLEVALATPLPEGVELSLRLGPKLDLPRGSRITLDNGRGMGLDNFFVEEVVVGEGGIVLVPVRWPGEHSVTALVSRGGRGGSYIRKLEPRSITLPATGAMRITLDEQDVQRALERLR